MVLLGSSSSAVTSVIGLTTLGASSTELTLTVKVSVTFSPLDVASTVISAVPDLSFR